MSDAPLYEWGVAGRHRGPSDPHRTGMTEDEARLWVAEAERDGFRHGAFYVIRRHVSEWERGDTDE